MIDRILSILAPHLCSGCQQIGTLLCDNCKYNITSEPYQSCLSCEKPVNASGVCNRCRVPYVRAWCVGERTDALQRLIGLYKFERTQSAYKVLGDLLLDTLPVLPANTVVVPLPTVRAHVRERGFDHTVLIAKYIARKRGLTYRPLVERVHSSTQRHATAKQRLAQAKIAFHVNNPVDPELNYLLIDDVVTTGASITYASKALIDAGARHVWVAVIARQTLDKKA